MNHGTATPKVHHHAFSAMGSPCEVQVECDDPALARRLGLLAEAEARRIEDKYSRYRQTSFLTALNKSGGKPVTVDPETAGLLDYAGTCFALSEGRFDITSGVLRKVWKFDGSDRVPDRAAVEAILPLVGWEKLGWQAPELVLPEGMEIDLGGIGKEYAVDRAAIAIMQESDAPALINFGGDLRVTRPRAGDRRWRIVIDAVDASKGTPGLLEIGEGALTTSGDARRFLLKDGVRYGHILDPRTGYPVEHTPRSVTVAAPTCMQAGTLSTLAMLHGADAETFLATEGVQSWVLR